jgi:hypothetical protein
MKIKILSLVLIALLAVNSVNAGVVYTHYPFEGTYRYTSGEVGISIFYSNAQYSDGIVFTPAYGHIVVGTIEYTGNSGENYPTGCIIHHDYANQWQVGHYNAVYIPPEAIGQTLYINVHDGSFLARQHSHVRIWNYKGNDVSLIYYDRGLYRDPHVEICYKGRFYDGGEGGDINIY